MAYLTTKFRDAVLTLSGNGPVKQRLAQAFLNQLDELHDDELPLDQRGRFSKLRKRLHQVAPLNGEGPVRASVRKMSPKEASDCAALIVEIYSGILEKDLNGASLYLVNGEANATPEIPRFLVKP